jgi:hypothetical protein
MYKAIEDYRSNVPGAHWDNTSGANIQGATATTVFDVFVSQKVCFHLFIYFILQFMHVVV